MSDFADDVARYLTPEQQASSLLFGDLDSLPEDRDSRKWIEPGTGGKFVSFDEVVERYRMRSRGDWMQTATGRAFYPLDPQPEEIHIEDIAAALSKLCRYGGHSRRFYSVAEHCVHIADSAPDQLKLQALLHDSPEAFAQDIIRPIKPHLPGYAPIEARLARAIGTRFGVTLDPLSAEVKRLDNAILADERDQAMATPPQDWCLSEPPLGVTLQFWSPDKAEYEFLAMFRRLNG